MKSTSGFTIVELLIVIVVIGILAAITVVSYQNITARAADTRIRATVGDVGKALRMAEITDEARPTSQGYFQNNGGVDDLLVPDYLSASYRDGISSVNVDHDSRIFRYYQCADSLAIYASLNNPSTRDVANFESVKARCGHTTQAPATSNLPRYNYAQVF